MRTGATQQISKQRCGDLQNVNMTLQSLGHLCEVRTILLGYEQRLNRVPLALKVLLQSFQPPDRSTVHLVLHFHNLLTSITARNSVLLVQPPRQGSHNCNIRIVHLRIAQSDKPQQQSNQQQL